MTIGEQFNRYKNQLSDIYDSNESESIAVMVFEHLMNIRRVEIILKKSELIDNKTQEEFEKILDELRKGKPIQYILGYSWFCGMKLMVSSDVLIPRRETEELVNWIINDSHQTNPKGSSILDLCTGSGCIALALKKEFKEMNVLAIDNSEKALSVAKKNADTENLEIDFINGDVLNLNLNLIVDIIVSNPPYVTLNEKILMEQRVIDFEPSEALFVTDSDPLIFYKAIAKWGIKNLNPSGKIYFEINEALSDEIKNLLSEIGFKEIELKKDLQEKYRMVKAIR
jgi:release factor glutamine methyltransferase